MSAPRPAASRMVPRVGDAAWVLRGSTRAPATIVEVEGRTVTVEAGEEHLVFDLHPLTAHFVLRGEPSYGTRLALTGGASDVLG